MNCHACNKLPKTNTKSKQNYTFPKRIKYITHKKYKLILQKRVSSSVISSTTLVSNPIRESNGFQIQINWDSSVEEQKKTFVLQAAQKLVDLFTTPVIHTITVMNMTSGLGESETSLVTLTYSELKSIYNPNQNSITKLISAFNLPDTDPFPGTTYIMTPTQYMAFGGITTPGSSVVLINFGQQNFDLTSVALHEITETMGRIGGYTDAGITYHSLMDLCSFSSFGVRSANYAQGGFFSPDNGSTNYAFFNTNPTGDSRDWSGETLSTDCCNAFASPNTTSPLSTNDLAVMEGLGFFLSSVLCTPNTLSTTQNTSISITTNFTGLLNAEFSIAPPLPNNLSITDGTIQGVVTATLPQTVFTVNVGSNFISEQGNFDLTVSSGSEVTSGLSTGAIVGIVLGSIGFVLLVVLIAYFLSKN